MRSKARLPVLLALALLSLALGLGYARFASRLATGIGAQLRQAEYERIQDFATVSRSPSRLVSGSCSYALRSRNIFSSLDIATPPLWRYCIIAHLVCQLTFM